MKKFDTSLESVAKAGDEVMAAREKDPALWQIGAVGVAQLTAVDPPGEVHFELAIGVDTIPFTSVEAINELLRVTGLNVAVNYVSTEVLLPPAT